MFAGVISFVFAKWMNMAFNKLFSSLFEVPGFTEELCLFDSTLDLDHGAKL